MLIGWGQNMSGNKQVFGAHFQPWPSGRLRKVSITMPTPITPRTSTARSLPAGWTGTHQDIGLAPVQFAVALASALLWAALCVVAALTSPAARAQALVPDDAMPSPLQAQVQDLLKQQALPQGADSDAASRRQPWRVEVVLGQLDPRLKLAPCDKVRAYLPEGVQMWGKTRVGLRCEHGPVRWNVYWPVTVKVWGHALVAASTLRPGKLLTEGDLRPAEVDLAAQTSPAITRVAEILGRSVVRVIEPGQGLRQDDVKARRWFAAGDPVRLTVRGEGFQVASEGLALTHGDEGRCARVRTDSGRIVCGQPVGERQVELAL